MLEHGLDAPEAAAREHDRLLAGACVMGTSSAGAGSATAPPARARIQGSATAARRDRGGPGAHKPDPFSVRHDGSVKSSVPYYARRADVGFAPPAAPVARSWCHGGGRGDFVAEPAAPAGVRGMIRWWTPMF